MTLNVSINCFLKQKYDSFHRHTNFAFHRIYTFIATKWQIFICLCGERLMLIRTLSLIRGVFLLCLVCPLAFCFCSHTFSLHQRHYMIPNVKFELFLSFKHDVENWLFHGGYSTVRRNGVRFHDWPIAFQLPSKL